MSYAVYYLLVQLNTSLYFTAVRKSQSVGIIERRILAVKELGECFRACPILSNLPMPTIYRLAHGSCNDHKMTILEGTSPNMMESSEISTTTGPDLEFSSKFTSRMQWFNRNT